MNKSYPFVDVQRLLSSAQHTLVLIPGLPSFDQVASALALYLSLVKSGHQVSVLCPDDMLVEFSRLVGVDKVGNKPPSGELVLTVNVPIENIEKVTSTDESGKLNLTIKPKAGSQVVSKEDILFSSMGATADALFVIEAKKIDSLGKIYQENTNLFKEKPIINISHYPKAESFGKINIIDPAASCSSEIMASLIQGLNLSVDEDISSNLLLGLKNATSNFQSPLTTAETFEAAAFCLRNRANNTQISPKQEVKKEETSAAPSPDWFEPKIYKGSTLP